MGGWIFITDVVYCRLNPHVVADLIEDARFTHVSVQSVLIGMNIYNISYLLSPKTACLWICQWHCGVTSGQ